MSEAIKKETETKNLLKISWRKLQGLLSNNSLKSIRRNYGVPLTNAGESVKVAMDAALETSGHFTTIRNAVASGGIDAYPQFLGYAYLSGLQQNGFIRAGVEGLADDMTARFIELIRTSDIENNDDDKINKINEYLNAFQIKELFNKAAALCGYFGGCLIYVDTDDEDLLSALDEKSLNHSIKGYVLIEPINIYPGRYNSTNPLRADYFIPETWFVLGQEVHASRLLYLAADEVNMLLKPAYNFFGIAPAQIAADSVSHFIKDREAASRLLHKYSLLVLKTDMGSVLYNGNPEELYDRIKVLADFRDNNSVFVIDKEDEDIVTVTTSIAGITDIVRLSLELMPIMFRQPLTKFLGISPGGMNATGESDENNWNEYVLSQCEKIFRKPVKRLLELIQYDLFGEVDEKIDFIFKIQSSNDETKEINNNKIKADTYVQLTTAGIISPEEARKALAEDEKSGFNSIDVDNVPEPVNMGGSEDLFGGLGLDWDPFAYDEFDESKVHRKANGQFGTGGSNNSTTNNEPFGKAYSEYSGKPKEAIEYLIKKKNGHVPNAIYKEGIGNIDIVWGEEGKGKGGYGLAHIIRRRNEEGYDGEEFVKQLPNIINNGKVYKKEGHPDRIYVGDDIHESSIRLSWNGEERTWLVSGYIKRRI
ncbi:MAG: DUF1073 domain-containing protein [Candidatus Mucispirillum faecigallinarum]|nr:DUF1073 domain-containing protein [Candidatus Mucispirillum faecigallinarum]